MVNILIQTNSHNKTIRTAFTVHIICRQTMLVCHHCRYAGHSATRLYQYEASGWRWAVCQQASDVYGGTHERWEHYVVTA